MSERQAITQVGWFLNPEEGEFSGEGDEALARIRTGVEQILKSEGYSVLEEVVEDHKIIKQPDKGQFSLIISERSLTAQGILKARSMYSALYGEGLRRSALKNPGEKSRLRNLWFQVPLDHSGRRLWVPPDFRPSESL
jgi:hypothetical protein